MNDHVLRYYEDDISWDSLKMIGVRVYPEAFYFNTSRSEMLVYQVSMHTLEGLHAHTHLQSDSNPRCEANTTTMLQRQKKEITYCI